MWQFSYPTRTPSEIHAKAYDYIIVGGGTAGCVLASRLSEDPNVTVLVIEKGHVKDNIVSRIPLLSQNIFLGDPLQVQSTRWSEPIPEANGRRVRIWTAEGLGGASRINAMLMTRGCRADYVAWSKELGLSDWGWEQVEPYFRKIENAVERPDSQTRGHNGPVEARANKLPFEWGPYIEKSFQKVGVPLGGDCNGPEAPAMGLFHVEAAIDKRSRRISAFQAFLGKRIAKERLDRLTVCTGAIVSRLDVDGPSGLVRGVHIQSSQAGKNATSFFVQARKEVILCSGAICTPQILLLSGIGPRSREPQSESSPDIPLMKELPAVGTMFSDHYSFPIMLELPKRETFHLLESIWGLWHILLWIFLGKGLFARTTVPSAAYIRTGAIDTETMSVKSHEADGTDNLDASQPKNRPDVEIMIMPINGLQRPVPGHAFLNFHPTVIQPHATGRIELSKNAQDNPRIIYPMFTDERDLAAARLAVRFTMRLAAEFQNSGYPYPTPFAFAPGNSPELLRQWEQSADEWSTPQPVSSAVPHAGQPAIKKTSEGKTWKNVTDDEIDDYVRRVSHTSLHPVCTCPMSNDERSGVVDQKLRVYGFKNLRIADASVFPRVPTSHTMIPVMMIAERCASFVKQDREANQLG
ncbi:hypothetical protein N8I77_000152 [Diaporthe amygdali]|uniref:Glucose-methanol-choline oxidoreductase N-terminal domain-containing protein n=1 Tax=Phomopsis amygdali TaxID=1214568 RepID=A0AAD9SNV3_PHOAM|nr:hypothetical protein N8I77_000152 [Diaporthe amygdali]